MVRKDEINEEELEKFWNVKIPWLGITKWQYVVGLFVMGTVSIILSAILIYLIYFT